MRVDSWIWSARLTKTRSIASNACRDGHVLVNGVRVKPAHVVRVGDEVRHAA
ncbi:S4 domain-containing protein [Nonomuraea sp. NPDC049784]|uniref:S4 domain-containing protein n=1 Tax=Nonomuraea sp. NPDC049784 TaxID=3154361 RepID=UPI0033D6A936